MNSASRVPAKFYLAAKISKNSEKAKTPCPPEGELRPKKLFYTQLVIKE